MTDLVKAAQQSDYLTAKVLLDRGMNVNGTDGAGDAAIHWAAWLGDEKLFRLLLEKGANIHQKGGAGKTALQLAREGKRDHIVRILEDLIDPPRPVQPLEGWAKMGEQSVAHVGTYPALEKKITTIFNFTSRDRTIISESLKNGTQGVGPSTSFDSLPREAVEQALGQFVKLGGKADSEYVLKGASTLDKPKLGKPNG